MLIAGLDIYSRTVLKVESKFVACCLNSGESSTSLLSCSLSFFFPPPSYRIPLIPPLEVYEWSFVFVIIHSKRGSMTSAVQCSAPFISLHESAFKKVFRCFFVCFLFCSEFVHSSCTCYT